MKLLLTRLGRVPEPCSLTFITLKMVAYKKIALGLTSAGMFLFFAAHGWSQSGGPDQKTAITSAIQGFPSLWKNVSMVVREGTDATPPGSPDNRKPTAKDVVTERNYELVAVGLDVRIDRFGHGLMRINKKGDMGPIEDRSTQWFVDGKRYVNYGFVDAPRGSTDQGAFSSHRGTLPTPLQFSYQRYDHWLSDYLGGFDWQSIREVSNPHFGQVIAVDRKGDFGPETVEFWPDGGYMMVGITFHGGGRAFQYNTTEAQQVQGVWFPKRAEELRFSSEDTSQKPEQKIIYEVDDLRFNQDLPADLMVPTWAENSTVKDGDATIYYTVRKGKLVFDPSMNPGKSPIKPMLFVGSFAALVGFIGFRFAKKKRSNLSAGAA